jgi:glycosyltransferase involved in cell wall biosynthesis
MTDRYNIGMEKFGLKVLMISSDRTIVESGSGVSERMKEYGKLVRELHIVLLSDASHELKDTKIGDNVFVYPTNSRWKFFRPIDAGKIGNKLVFERGFVRGVSLITAQDPFECGWAGLKIKRRWRIPIEIQLHTDFSSPRFSGVLNGFRKRLARRVINEADTIRVVMEHLKSTILTMKPDAEVSVLPILVDRAKIMAEPKMSLDLHSRYGWRLILLSVARLTKEKNLRLALEILKLVKSRYSDVGLVIVGDGPELKRLKSLVKKLKLTDNVVFAMWQNDPSPYYRTADIFLQTSHFEGYGMALIEAGLHDLAVVTTPVGFALDLEHGREAYIFPEDRPELFTQGIVELAENRAKRRELIISMRKNLESILLSKEDYFGTIKKNWQATALKIGIGE